MNESGMCVQDLLQNCEKGNTQSTSTSKLNSFLLLSLTSGVSDPQVCPWHQPSKCPDGWHEGSGSGGGQGGQHRPGTPQGSGENLVI